MKYGITQSPGNLLPFPNHTGDMPEGTVNAILKQAGIDIDDFLLKN
jgi:hypothetical protein